MKGFIKIFLLSTPIGIIGAVILFLVGYTYINLLDFTGVSSGNEKEQFYKILTYSCIVGAIIAPLANVVVFFYQSRKKASDPNRFRRKHIRRFNIKGIDKNHLTNELDRLGYIDIEIEKDKITAIHPGVRMPQTHPVFVGKWYRARKLEVNFKENELVVTMEPIVRRELMDFSLSNYFFLDALVKELEWEGYEVKEVSR